MRSDNAKYCHGKLITAPHRMATTTMITICHAYTVLYKFITLCVWVPILKYNALMVVIVVLCELDLCLDWNVETRKEQYTYIFYILYYLYCISMKLSSWASTSKTSITQQCALASSYIYAMFVSTSIYYFLWPDLRFPAICSIIVVVSAGDRLLTVYRG